MKKHLLLLLGILLLSIHPARAQVGLVPGLYGGPPGFRSPNNNEDKALPRFDLDFPGGTPGELVRAIEKAPYRPENPAAAVAGGGGPPPERPLNAIIPEDCANVRIPAISVKNVTVPQLFEAVTFASREVFPGFTSTYGFRTQSTPSENSIWYFYWDKPPVQIPSPVCKFYQLSSYLDAGYKVEDITTAIETGWKMLGVNPQPDIKYHNDTRMLIAVGDEWKLRAIDDALRQLAMASPKQKPSSSQDAEKSKTK